jgi:hypothetical protein
MKPTYSNCIEGLACHAVAVIDDFYLIGPRYQAFTALDRFNSRLPYLNLTLSLPKCNALLPANPSMDLINDCTSRFIPHFTESIPALGLSLVVTLILSLSGYVIKSLLFINLSSHPRYSLTTCFYSSSFLFGPSYEFLVSNYCSWCFSSCSS